MQATATTTTETDAEREVGRRDRSGRHPPTHSNHGRDVNKLKQAGAGAGAVVGADISAAVPLLTSRARTPSPSPPRRAHGQLQSCLSVDFLFSCYSFEIAHGMVDVSKHI